MAEPVDINKIPTAGGGVNKPASGTYGEAASLERLKQALPMDSPAPGGPGQSGPAPMPTPPTGGGMSTPAAPGVPGALLAPTARPDVPITTPLAQAPVNPIQLAETERQRNLARLDALTSNPNVSQETKEWARVFRDNLIQASKR